MNKAPVIVKADGKTIAVELPGGVDGAPMYLHRAVKMLIAGKAHIKLNPKQNGGNTPAAYKFSQS